MVLPCKKKRRWPSTPRSGVATYWDQSLPWPVKETDCCPPPQPGRGSLGGGGVRNTDWTVLANRWPELYSVSTFASRHWQSSECSKCYCYRTPPVGRLYFLV